MSKKQQTLQSWVTGAKSNAKGSKNDTKKAPAAKKTPATKRTPTARKAPAVAKKATAEVTLLDSDEDDEEMMRRALDESLNYQQPTATAVENLPGFDAGAGDRWIYPTNYPVRKYQRTIVETCLFRNTLVSLPTGLGKTFIAAVVMYNFFRWYPGGKVVFLAPTKPLVAQQVEACHDIMGIPPEETSQMTGAVNPDARAVEWKEKRVFYLTPQVIANDISRGSCPVKDIKCLVLDEAHKAIGNYAYVTVVSELTQQGVAFRVLALSATPGSDLKAVQQVVSNLRIESIEMRNEESADIVPYVHKRSVDKVVVDLGAEVSSVRDTFLLILGGVARRLMNLNLLFTKDLGSLSRLALLRWRDAFRQNPPGSVAKERRGLIEADFALCISLVHALELLQQHGVRTFFNFLHGKTDPDGDGGRIRTELQKLPEFRQMMNEIEPKMSRDDFVSHPKIRKLVDIVVQHFSEAEREGVPTRVMIFSQWRDSVEEIAQMLQRHEPLVKAMKFVGHGQSKTKVKFTQNDQLRVVKQFRDGSYNTLVSTCVGEEGLDIGDVDLIVCYDAHQSPVRLVQRMGRTGRKRDGRIVQLMTSGKEESVFNASMCKKATLLKSIVAGGKLQDHLSVSPRMIPAHIEPRCHEMPMTVQRKAAKPAPTSAASTAAPSAPVAASSALRKGRTTKTFYLSEPETEYWNSKWRCLEAPALLAGSSGDAGTGRQLRLDRWLPWQCSLQATCAVGASDLTRHYVDLLQSLAVVGRDDASDTADAVDDLPQSLGADSMPTALAEADPAPQLDEPIPDWRQQRGLYSPTFLRLFDADEAVGGAAASPPLDFGDPPAAGRRRRLSTPAAPVQDDDVDVTFPSFRFDASPELVRPLPLGGSTPAVAELNVKPIHRIPTVEKLEERTFLTPTPVRANFDVDFDLSDVFGADTEAPEVEAAVVEAPVANFDLDVDFDSPTGAQTCSPKAPVANFEVDLDLSDLTDDIIPQTPPRVKVKAETSPVLSQRRKSFKRKLELVCAAAPVLDAPPQEKRAKVEPVGVPETQFMSIPVQPIATKQEPLLSLTQVMDLMDGSRESSPVIIESVDSDRSEDVSPTPPTPSASHNEAADGVDHRSAWDDGFELNWSDIEELDALTKGDAEDVVPVAVEEATKPKIEVVELDESTSPELPEEDASPKMATTPPSEDHLFHQEDDDSPEMAACKTRRRRPAFLMTQRTPSAAPATSPAESDQEDDNSPEMVACKTRRRRPTFLMTQRTPSAARAISPVEDHLFHQDVDSPMTQSTPLAVEAARRRPARRRPAAECDFIEQEADVSSDVTASEDEAVGPDDDLYEASFVDDLAATQHHSEEMRAVYLRSLKSPLANGRGFVLRQPKTAMNRSEIFSQADVEEDSYEMDSFCVDNDDIEYFDETAPSFQQPVEPRGRTRQRQQQQQQQPQRPQQQAKPKGRHKRIVAPADSSSSSSNNNSNNNNNDSSCSSGQATPPPATPPPATPPPATPPPHSRSPSMMSTPSPLANLFDISREERLRKQREQQQRFRQGLASASASAPLTVLVSSRQVGVTSEILSGLRVDGRCAPHVCTVDGADFVLSSQRGVLRKVHSEFANGAQRAKLQQQIKRLTAEFERPVLVVELDRPARSEQRGRDAGAAVVGPAAAAATPYVYLTMAALAQTDVLLVHTTSQRHTAEVLAALAKQEAAKGLALPDAERLAPNRKAALQLLLRLPHCNAAVALLLAERFDSLRHVLTSSSETIASRCRITAGRARDLHRVLRMRLPAPPP